MDGDWEYFNIPLAARLGGSTGITCAHGSEGGRESSGGNGSAGRDLGESLAEHDL